ncbi:hypothetical protein AB0H76_30845 [Nocardia sp. NPDC050712]
MTSYQICARSGSLREIPPYDRDLNTPTPEFDYSVPGLPKNAIDGQIARR